MHTSYHWGKRLPDEGVGEKLDIFWASGDKDWPANEVSFERKTSTIC